MKYDKKILEDPSAPVMALIYVIVKNYTTEAFNWNPQLLRNELEEDFDLKLTDLQSDKIQAGITVLTTNMYESDVRTFEVCTRLLTHNAQDFEDFQPLEAEELVAGLTEVMLIKMEDITFGDDVTVLRVMRFISPATEFAAFAGDTAENPPIAKAAAATSAMRLKLVFVDIIFLSRKVAIKNFFTAAWFPNAFS